MDEQVPKDNVRLFSMLKWFFADDLASRDDEELKIHFQEYLRKMRRAALLLMISVLMAFVVLLSLALAGVRTWWVYSALFLAVGATGCLFSILAYPLLLAFDDLSDRLPQLRGAFERQIRLTASVGCIAVIAASLCFIIPIHKNPGLILLAVMALPVTAIAAYLGWAVFPTWALQKLVLLPLVVFVGAVAAVQFPVTANYVGWFAGHADRYLVRRARNLVPDDVIPTRLDLPLDCGLTFFDVVTREPIIWYYRSSDGGFELWSNPGGHPATGKDFDLADTEEERQAILDWCRHSRPRIDPPVTARPQFDICVSARQVLDHQDLGGDSTRLVLESLIKPTGLSIGSATDGSCPQGLAEYRIVVTVMATRLGPATIATGTLYRWRMHLDGTIKESATGKTVTSFSQDMQELHKETADNISMEAFARAARELGPELVTSFVKTLRAVEQ